MSGARLVGTKRVRGVEGAEAVRLKLRCSP